MVLQIADEVGWRPPKHHISITLFLLSLKIVRSKNVVSKKVVSHEGIFTIFLGHRHTLLAADPAFGVAFHWGDLSKGALLVSLEGEKFESWVQNQ